MNEEILKRIDTLEARISNLEKGSIDVQTPPTSPKRAQVSVVEFLKEKKPSSSVDKTLVFAVYHEIIAVQMFLILRIFSVSGDKRKKLLLQTLMI